MEFTTALEFKISSQQTSGYIKKTENSQESGWLELNASVKEFSLKSVPKGQEVLIVIGEKLSKERAALYLGRNPDV